MGAPRTGTTEMEPLTQTTLRRVCWIVGIVICLLALVDAILSVYADLHGGVHYIVAPLRSSPYVFTWWGVYVVYAVFVMILVFQRYVPTCDARRHVESAVRWPRQIAHSLAPSIHRVLYRFSLTAAPNRSRGHSFPFLFAVARSTRSNRATCDFLSPRLSRGLDW